MLRVLRAHKYSLSLIAAAASWGTATVISKRAVEEIEPLTLLPIELAVSVAVLAAAVSVSRERVRWSPELGRLGLLGVLNPGISYALSLAGLARITASMSVLLWAIEPLLILALAFWILKDRISKPPSTSSANVSRGTDALERRTEHRRRIRYRLLIIPALASYTAGSTEARTKTRVLFGSSRAVAPLAARASSVPSTRTTPRCGNRRRCLTAMATSTLS